MDEIVGEFLVECYEGLDRLDQNFIVLEETPHDTQTLTEVFRTLHTIKGTCGFLGFSELERVAHRGENLLSLLRDSVLQINGEITDALLATVDAIRAILESIEETEEEGQHDNEALINTLERLAEPGSAPPAACEPSAEAGPEALATAAEPAAEAVPAETASAEVEPAGAVAAAAEPAEAVGAEPPEAVAVEAAAAEPSVATEPAEAVPAEAAAVEAAPSAAGELPPTPAADRIGDLLVADEAVSRVDVEIAATEQGMGDSRPIGQILVDEGRAEKEAVDGAAAKQRGAADSTIRVDVAVLDTLMNLVGELVLSRNQIIQLSAGSESQEFAVPAQRLNLITSELQEGVMKTRMQPIGAIWNKLPRVVRDLSHQFGKQIRLDLEGKETELDKTILEAIKDPLTHMVRNTVDHGIESPEIRVAAGKEPEGVLRLSATHEGGQVNIEITDDGAGIDVESLRAKGVEKGVITADAASKMSDAEALQLIFAAGFSTAKKVSNVSGRGVGMDVVRSNVERIGGSVDIKTELGQGTTFKIKIPLTLAIIPAITVTCDSNRYAIPQLSLQELVLLKAHDPDTRIESVHGAPVYRLRGRLLPIVDLREQLEAEPVEEAEDRSINIVVLQADGNSFGLIVDSIQDTEEIVVKPLGREVKDIAMFSGATIMGDGTVALILDVMGLANKAHILAPGGHADSSIFDPDHHMNDPIEDRILLVGFSDESKAAIPLAEVERLEEFGPEQIEESEHRSVVQYRGEIMPLIDLGPCLAMGAPAIDGTSRVSVVVCSYYGVSVGLAVRKILDIVSKPEVLRGTDGRVNRAIVDGQVTDVVSPADVIAPYIPAPESSYEMTGVSS